MGDEAASVGFVGVPAAEKDAEGADPWAEGGDDADVDAARDTGEGDRLVRATPSTPPSELTPVPASVTPTGTAVAPSAALEALVNG